MKREFLKGLNLEEEVIDKIMSQYGEDIEKYKAQADELEKLKKDLKSRDEQLETLKTSTANIDDLKKQIEALQNQNKEEADKYGAQLRELKINNAVEKALTSAKAKNQKVVLPLLSDFLAKAKLDDDGNVAGLDEQIKKLAEDENTSFLFQSAQKNSLSGLVPGNKSEVPVGFVDQASFDANKNNPEWINKNWDTISIALKEGTIKK